MIIQIYMHLHMHVIIPIRIVLLTLICIYSLDGMQEVNQLEPSINIQRPIVIRALRRSNIRKKVVEYLFEISPSTSYTSEIAYNVKTTPTNVIGAIRGMGSRYKEDESLISLKLVEEKESSKNIRLYGLTSYGKEIIESLRDNK